MAPLIQVFDMPTSIRFYREILGFIVKESSEPGDDCDWVLLEKDGAELMLNTAYERDQRPPAPDPTRIASHGDICFYFGRPDVDAAYRDLLAKGVAANPPADAPYGMRQLYFSDPDGYGVCYQWPIK
jgi:catechol 2,3-dioxygenase-like lactoylglutathione lyase family enzyme